MLFRNMILMFYIYIFFFSLIIFLFPNFTEIRDLSVFDQNCFLAQCIVNF